tara:strand:- start:210988 stop:211575 length:588 start_codon:yes stop_codon:yes gene_type:complete
MSKSKQIADHDNALGLYFKEMLVESTVSAVTDKTEVQVDKADSVIEHDQNKSFQALLLDINGLQLAIRTEDIKAILPWPETLLKQKTDTFNNEALMGYYNHASDQIKIINTAYIVLPLQHRHNIATPSFMIVVGEGTWALSCHKINTIITLSPKDIRWRKNMGARPWLAGTSIEKRCSIVNLNGLVNLINPQILA